jgi:hypothetical protein
VYEWTWLQQPEQPEDDPERRRWILIRRSLTDPSERAYDQVAGPAHSMLADLVRVAGSRWEIEEAKSEVGLDHDEVCGYRAWDRCMTLALWAHAILVVVRSQSGSPETKNGCEWMRVAEVRRLIHALGEPEPMQYHRRRWSRFRRQQQAQARLSHVQRRAR